jgi:hypothetical protein
LKPFVSLDYITPFAAASFSAMIHGGISTFHQAVRNIEHFRALKHIDGQPGS